MTITSNTVSQDPAILASSGGNAMYGESSSPAHAAIAGIQTNTTPASVGAGVYGESRGGGAGVAGFNLGKAGLGPGGPGGYFKSEQWEGVIAETMSRDRAAIAAFQRNPESEHPAIYAEHPAGRTAAIFKGNVIVTGDLSFPGADFAEDFTIKDEVFAEPGTVMALNCAGELVPCVDPYEKKVVGVVAGAGSHRTGIVMDKQEKSAVRRQPIALVGKVFCKVDARYGAIEVGDLLTSSATHGHAMKAIDPARAFGSVLGKALAPLSDGLGLIPMLISLQ